MIDLNITKRAAATVSLLALVACGDDATAEPPCISVAPAIADTLRWSRNEVFLRGVAQALELPVDEMCVELGQRSCAKLHQLALGGNNPFDDGLYQPVSNTLPITTTVVDRVLLASCVTRADLDAAGTPVVFTELELATPSSAPDSAAARKQADLLIQRFHGRVATEVELDALAELATDATAREFAITSCFAVGSTTESLFL